MTEIRTAPRRAERSARTRRAARKRGWTVAKYMFLTACGVLLYRAAAAYALAERGYTALGGEVFFLFLPIIYYAFSTTIRGVIYDLKTGFKPEYWEKNENEETF